MVGAVGPLVFLLLLLEKRLFFSVIAVPLIKRCQTVEGSSDFKQRVRWGRFDPLLRHSLLTNLACFLQRSFLRATLRAAQDFENSLPVFLDSSNEGVAIPVMLGVVNPLRRLEPFLPW
jgi:hypothetical protein